MKGRGRFWRSPGGDQNRNKWGWDTSNNTHTKKTKQMKQLEKLNKKRDPHQVPRIQTQIDVFRTKITKQTKTHTQSSTHTICPGLGVIVGGQQVWKWRLFANMKKLIFYLKNIKSEQSGCPKVDTNRVDKKQKSRSPRKTPKWRGPRGHGDHWLTLVWPQGSLGRDKSTRSQRIQALKKEADYLTTPLGRMPGEFSVGLKWFVG